MVKIHASRSIDKTQWIPSSNLISNVSRFHQFKTGVSYHNQNEWLKDIHKFAALLNNVQLSGGYMPRYKHNQAFQIFATVADTPISSMNVLASDFPSPQKFFLLVSNS